MTTYRELTHLKCEKAVIRPKGYRIPDTCGLCLLVQPSGAKLWQWRYRFNGTSKILSLGAFPDLSLAAARVQHAQARALLAKGIDPMAERKSEKLAQKEQELATCQLPAPGLTFEDLARQWFKKWKENKNQRYADNVEVRLEQDVIGRIGKLRPEEIKRMDVVRLSQAVDERGANDIARRNLQFIRNIFDWGLVNGLLDENVLNPAANIKPEMILKNVPEKHFAHLDIREVPTLLRKMRDYNGTAMTRLAMELLSLTALRTGELMDGRWDEINWREARWNVPAERMKMKGKHIVPLSLQAITVLERLQAISGKTDRIFPDYNGGTGIMSKNTILKALERMGYKGRMTGHGWRAIFSTYLREHHYDKDHIEVQLAHLTGTAVSRAYDYALYLEPRTKMMQDWADALDRCRDGKIKAISSAA